MRVQFFFLSMMLLLALIADLYTPLLGIFYLRRALSGDLPYKFMAVALAGMLIVAWGVGAADAYWRIWAGWSLDYSTHTAVALALVGGLAVTYSRYAFWWGLSLVAYASLMVALDYHSVLDIVTTAGVSGALMLPFARGLQRYCRKIAGA